MPRGVVKRTMKVTFGGQANNASDRKRLKRFRRTICVVNDYSGHDDYAEEEGTF